VRRAFPSRRRRSPTDRGAVLASAEEAVEQALSLARDGQVVTIDGTTIPVRADTLCIHGDTPGAPEFARRIHERFREEGIRIAPLEVTPSRDRRAQAAARLH